MDQLVPVLATLNIQEDQVLRERRHPRPTAGVADRVLELAQTATMVPLLLVVQLPQGEEREARAKLPRVRVTVAAVRSQVGVAVVLFLHLLQGA